ncbi:uridine 5'-monophosphate synthase isoform X3 [Ixodes scapularis]|uniref:uridine 5'-monophosphate synthase isoform X3 n=1 Tax=Ixodes scapularis TaxID=6945 RepID=UPI001C38FE8F|nr:uridine 5'-monophosphate synthase isoform X3 [Ixodes scapularis]
MANDLICKLVDAGGIKFGSFTLKSGITSPIYVDLRMCVSHPKLLHDIASLVAYTMQKDKIDSDLICGVPYTALPIATCVSMKTSLPMVMRRKEAKSYGTKQIIEGNYKAGQKCIVIEDIVSSGSSIIETAQALTAAGLVVTDAVVFLDREQGGSENLLQWNIKTHSIFKITDILDTLLATNRIVPDVARDVREFVRTVKAPLVPSLQKKEVKKLSFKERALLTAHPLAQRLFTIMEEKRTNLCVAADLTRSSEVLQLADVLGPHICIFKTHVDILEDFSPEFPARLKDLARKHTFLIMEDRKFADIGSTVQQQYTHGKYAIQTWADLVTVHAFPGPAVLTALKQASQPDQGCVIVAEMSSAGSLGSKEYTEASVKMGEDVPDFVLGFVSQSRVSDKPNFVLMTPGVQMDTAGDALGQQYCSPSTAVGERGADVIIVGRGITKSEDPAAAAQEYQKAGYDAYMASVAT